MAMQEAPEGLAALTALVARLRGQGGCPWDQRQTPESLLKYLREECEELVCAVQSGDQAAVREESGDLLFVLTFLIRLYEEQDAFSWQEVCADAQAKMVRRHPHVFGDSRASSEAELKQQWAEIKAAEKRARQKP